MSTEAEFPPDNQALRGIAEAMGLDPDVHRITAISLSASVKEPLRASVFMLCRDERGRLGEVVRRFRMSEERAEPVASDAPMVPECGDKPKPVTFREFM